ncbi:unnamed protein product [Litomosoides sigmodontis]|uniref:Uncharacterized protein n=1 Tax=Litomosoides sigmodontis TaxID=42156 RepID=A0A3P6TUU5_LITSI|nr:unnamed protein product [Litomosoides sigmodontis]
MEDVAPFSRSAYQTGAFTIYETTGSARIDTRYMNYTMVICGANWRYPCEWRLWHADRHRYPFGFPYTNQLVIQQLSTNCSR